MFLFITLCFTFLRSQKQYEHVILVVWWGNFILYRDIYVKLYCLSKRFQYSAKMIYCQFFYTILKNRLNYGTYQFAIDFFCYFEENARTYQIQIEYCCEFCCLYCTNCPPPPHTRNAAPLAFCLSKSNHNQFMPPSLTAKYLFTYKSLNYRQQLQHTAGIYSIYHQTIEPNW